MSHKHNHHEKYEFTDQYGDSIRIWQVKNGNLVFYITSKSGDEIAVVLPPNEIPEVTAKISAMKPYAAKTVVNEHIPPVMVLIGDLRDAMEASDQSDAPRASGGNHT